jgi:hypothetical protein
MSAAVGLKQPSDAPTHHISISLCLWRTDIIQDVHRRFLPKKRHGSFRIRMISTELATPNCPQYPQCP